MSHRFTIVVTGGGAAGFFAAITAARANPSALVILLEKSNALLSKVRISGGGRCNVTHACFDPKILVKNYPRGEKALLGPFYRFQPKDTIEWFTSRGVELKTEEDGRMFPVSDSSQTIIDCLMQEAKRVGVQIKLQHRIKSLEKKDAVFHLELADHPPIICNRLILCTGGNKEGFEFASLLGHHIVPPVPSLFTFNIPHFGLVEMAGVSVDNVQIKIMDTTLVQTGPLLITHWGFSGPAVLKLSAWGARYLHEVNYKATVSINWLPEYSQNELMNKLIAIKSQHSTKAITTQHDLPLPKQLWRHFIALAGIEDQKKWGDISHKSLGAFSVKLQNDLFQIDGKTTHKQEFVTCGGVDLDEVNFKTMESKKVPGLYFAGEILDIDGVTGGFNFQNAWTTGWIAGQSASVV